jgi:hypothetical protein
MGTDSERITTANFSYPSSAAAVVFGGYLPPGPGLAGLTGNRPQYAPAWSFLRYRQC